MAREIGDATSIVGGLLFGAHVYQLAGDKKMTASMTGEFLAMAEKHGLPTDEGYAALIHAWAINDLARLNTMMETIVKLGFKCGQSYYGSLIADSLAERKRYDDAIARIDQCLLCCEVNGEHYYEPELHRLRAVYCLQREMVDKVSVRASLMAAIRCAREYGALRTEALSMALLRNLDGSNIPHI